MTLEMGKTLVAAEAEVDQVRPRRCASTPSTRPAFLRRRAGRRGRRSAPRRRTSATSRSASVLAIMPWNFPLWQAMRFAAPALMAGNVGLLKHASNVPQTALLPRGAVPRRAGFPDGVFQTLLIGCGEVETVLRDRRVAAATLTGSEPAGQSVGRDRRRRAQEDRARARRQRPVRRDAVGRPRPAAEVAVTARCQNNGQSCIAAKRFIVHADVVRRVRASCSSAAWPRCVVGDPMDEKTDVGPLATRAGPRRRGGARRRRGRQGRHASLVRWRARRTGRAGSTRRPWSPDITPEMRMYREEVFGPVAALFRVPDLDEAIALANVTRLRPRLQRLDERRRPSRSGSSATSRPAWSSSTA